MIKNFLNPEGHQNTISGSKVTAILLQGWILPIVGASSGEGLRLQPAQQACFLYFLISNDIHPKDPGIVPYPLATLKCLNMWNLFGLFKTERQPDLDHYSVKRSPHMSNSLRCGNISKFPGVWHYSWVFREASPTMLKTSIQLADLIMTNYYYFF